MSKIYVSKTVRNVLFVYGPFESCYTTGELLRDARRERGAK